MNNKNKIIIIIIAVLTVITLGGLTYAFFSANNVQGNSSTNTIVTLTADYGNITVTYDGSNGIINASNIDLKNSEKGTNKLYLLKFYINSTATINQDITIKWKDINNTFCQYASGQSCTNNSSDTYVGSELSYNLYTCTQTNYTNATTTNAGTNCTSIGSNSTPTANTKITSDNYLTLAPGSTTYYVLLLTLQNKTTEQNYNQGKSFTGQVDIQRYNPNALFNKILVAHPPVSDAIASIYVSSGDGIDFAVASSPTNGQGLYINNKANVAGDSTLGTVKYFRGGTYCNYTDYLTEDLEALVGECIAAGGTVDFETLHCSIDDNKSLCEGNGFTYYELKNNVMFAGFAWKIVRINADDSIRLIYNGTSPSDRGISASIGESPFNTNDDDNAYVGYMYGSVGSSTYAATHTNTNNSTIKGIVDTWYQNNLLSYANKIADAGFCGDRSLYGGVGYGTNPTLYGSSTPINSLGYNCINNNDLYTLTTNNIGNKALTYPIGLITVDEVVYAGGTFFNIIYYLYNGYKYWTITPYDCSEQYCSVLHTDSLGGLDARYGVDDQSLGARPVISLKADVLISSGTGTLTDPWIIAS